MTYRVLTRLSVATAILALLMSGAAAIGVAQTPTPGKKMAGHSKGMSGMPGMGGMMNGPHQVLALAYRDNLTTFARALARQLSESKAVNVDLARPATAEMRRSFDQMREHHQAHVKTMDAPADSTLPAMASHMEAHLAALNVHLTALETEVNAGAPDAAKVSEHTTEILKECAGMFSMAGKAKPHRMK